MENAAQYNGRILKGIGGFYYVEAADTVFECKARGIFRKTKISPLVGDLVKITVNPLGENTVDEILPRKNSLIRPPLANIDRLIIVVSTCSPAPNTFVTDKLTAIACHKGISPVLVISKADLNDAQRLVDIYSCAGFPTFAVSSLDGEGTQVVKEILTDGISAFTGNSGVGKSTLLNAIDSRLGLATGEISDKLGRGRHTTRHCELFPLGGGYVADTPGFSSLDLERYEHIKKEELPDCFPEFAPYLGKCRFTSCTHVNDKGCAVVEAVENGEIQKTRHESYVAMYQAAKNIKEWECK